MEQHPLNALALRRLLHRADEWAKGPLDTLTLMGWDAEVGRCFARSIENHGFARDYTVTVDGRSWTLSGEHERATYSLSQDERTREIF